LATAERGLVSLTDVLREVKDRYEAPAHDKGLLLRCECPESDLPIWGDRGELDRIMNNLVSNAVKYTQQGEVCVLAERIDGFARVVVSDTGIGIPEDALPQLFQEFYRAPNAKEIKETGTGLGLAIVKDLVERYDGTIEVESSKGEGTTFTLTLPLAEAPSA
jgi:signal transduction histidine kinase